MILSSKQVPWYLAKGIGNYAHRKTCVQMLIATLFVIAEIWKQPWCPLTGEWINKLCYTQTRKYYSALKEMSYQALNRFEETVNALLQSERSQSEKVTCYIIPTI